MEFTDKQKKQYIRRYLNLAECSILKNGSLDFFDLRQRSEPLIREIMKHPKIKDDIKKSEIIWLIHDSFYRLQQRYKDKDVFEKIPNNELIEEANLLITFLEGLPYLHFFYFRLPIKLPNALSVIELTENVQIIRPSIAEKELFSAIDAASIENITSLADLLSNTYSLKVTEKDIYLKVKVSGYGQAAQARATSILKQFLYLTDASGLLTSYSWDRQNAQSFERNIYRIPAVEEEDLQFFTLSSEAALYLSGLKLNEKTFDGYKPVDLGQAVSFFGITSYKNFEEFFEKKFINGCDNFIRLQDEKKASDRDHIFSAIEWGFDGAANPNQTMGFIQLCIGLEALLGDKEEGAQKSLTEKLADRCAYLLGKTPSQRKNEAEKFILIYKLRSKLIHGVWPKVTDEQYITVMEAEKLLKRLIYQEIWLSGRNY